MQGEGEGAKGERKKSPWRVWCGKYKRRSVTLAVAKMEHLNGDESERDNDFVGWRGGEELTGSLKHGSGE